VSETLLGDRNERLTIHRHFSGDESFLADPNGYNDAQILKKGGSKGSRL
jgi:hypothetical protein